MSDSEESKEVDAVTELAKETFEPLNLDITGPPNTPANGRIPTPGRILHKRYR